MNDLIKILLAVLILAILAACSPRVPNSADAICEGTLDSRKSLRSALVVYSAPDRVLITGEHLLSSMAAACRR